MRILILTYEPWPTHRPDVTTLFGKYLPRAGIVSDLVAEAAETGQQPPAWQGGELISCARPSGRAKQHLAKLWLNLKAVFGADRRRYDCIQVRDMSVSALAGLLAARLKGIKFVYWLSYLQSEGHIIRARTRGMRAGLKYWYPLIEGWVGRFIVYRLVLPRADHVFVQSDAMKARLAAMGVPHAKMTPVPMGVDLEDSAAIPPVSAADPMLQGRRKLIYLGIQDRERTIEVLLYTLARVRAEIPDVMLIMAGDTPDQQYRDWLREEAARLGLQDHILWTGWISRTEAWSYLRTAEVGLSPFPRGQVLDTCSPTKAVEYMAFGLPVVCNDNPDQKQAIESSGAGLCTPLDPDAFAGAVISLLRNEELRRTMGDRGPVYVREQRSYARLAATVGAIYHDLSGIPPIETQRTLASRSAPVNADEPE